MVAEWVGGVVRTLQVAVGATLAGDVRDIQCALDHAIRELPIARTPEERIVLHSLLLDFAWRGSHDLHAHLHRSRRAVCHYRAEASLFNWFRRPGDPRDLFLDWMPVFVADLTRAHPPSKAGRVARVLREDFRRPLTLNALAHQQHMPAWRLRRAFAREFNVSIRAYREHARVLASLMLVTDGDHKLDVIAREVGYRSKKNFYRAFTQVTRMRPSAFRRCPADERLALLDRVRAVLAGIHIGDQSTERFRS